MGAKYRTYSLETKLKVIQSESPYYFKEEGVPRTTAIYWLKNAKRYEKVEGFSKELESSKLLKLERELVKERSEKELLKTVRGLHPYGFLKKKVKDKPTKKKIMEAVKAAAEQSNLKTVLSLIELSKSTYNRWKSDFRSCEITGKSCGNRQPNELTQEETDIIRKYVCSKQYAHISISSLCYLAQRDEVLYCSLDSWYKYTRMNDWRRPKRKEFKVKHRTGLRAKIPNEYWHVDISEIKVGNKVYYFQAVIDNFSRYVIDWILSDEKTAKNTVELIRRAHQKALLRNQEGKTALVSDMGSENTAGVVQETIKEIDLESLIARKDISFSNSMIESFFNGMKTMYLNFQKLRNKEDIERKLKFYIDQYNNKIPKKGLNGATPNEAYEESWGETELKKLKDKKQEAVVLRKSSHQKMSCKVCA